jgi:hypothetical protein
VKRFTVDSVKTGEYSLAIWDWDKYLDIRNDKVIANLADIYPNPNSGEFYLKTEENYSGTAQILNNIGVIIYQKNIQNTNTDIKFELSNLSDGLYFIKLIDDKTNRVIVKKIIVQK